MPTGATRITLVGGVGLYTGHLIDELPGVRIPVTYKLENRVDQALVRAAYGVGISRIGSVGRKNNRQPTPVRSLPVLLRASRRPSPESRT